jgi:hypothetical protein
LTVATFDKRIRLEGAYMSHRNWRVVRRAIAATALLGLAWATASYVAAQNRIPNYRLVADWPQYPKDMLFEMGTGIAVDARGVVYAISRDVDHWASHPLAMTRYRGRGTIAMFDRSGKFLGKFAEKEQFIGPHSMYIDSDGFFWIVDRDGHQVKKMREDGSVLLTLGEYGKFGNDATHFNGPTGVAFLPNGDFVVSDGYWNSRLVWFSKDGKFLKQVGKYGNAPGELGVVHAVALDSRGRLLVANVCGGALHPYVTVPGQIAPERQKPIAGCKSRFDVFTQDGQYVGPWSVVGGNLTLSIAAFGNRIYAGTTGEERGRQDLIIVDAATDTVAGVIRSADVYVHQMAMDQKTGDIYVASVYPEHGGLKRGIEGPSFRRFVAN